MGMSLRLAQTCSVCRQEIDRQVQQDVAVAVKLFGAAGYAVCPCCRQEVRDHTEPKYRRRVRRYLMRIKQPPTQEAP